jgi:hypothetical protein
VGERPVARFEARGSQLGETTVGFELRAVEALGNLERIVRLERAVDRPAQVDGRGTRLAEKGCRDLGIFASPRSKRHAVRPGQPDCRSPADRQGANAVSHLLDGVTANPGLFVRQPALVEHEQRPLAPA